MSAHKTSDAPMANRAAKAPRSGADARLFDGRSPPVNRPWSLEIGEWAGMSSCVEAAEALSSSMTNRTFFALRGDISASSTL